jgi:hypothetical protein
MQLFFSVDKNVNAITWGKKESPAKLTDIKR